MLYTISNEHLTVSVESFGAELRSIRSAGGTEYLWQRDGRYWGDASPVLFPYIARLYDKSYTYQGQRYSMDIHGFAMRSHFELEALSGDSLTLSLFESEESLKQYPFRFKLSMIYSLSGATLRVRCHIVSRDEKAMYFAYGAHPGFNVPWREGTVFEDYYLRFGRECSPVRIGFTDEVFLSGDDRHYPLEESRTLPLSHALFDEDAIILRDMDDSLILGCKGTESRLEMGFKGFPYFGIWHMPHTDAPYVCLEPWTSLPSRQGVIEELSEKEDLLMLPPGAEYENEWFVTVWEE